MNEIPEEKRIYVYESGIDKHLVRKHGRAFRGIKVEDVKRGKKFQRINVIAAQFKTTEGEINLVSPFCYIESTTGDLFESWFKTKLVKSVSKGSTIIMDNASFHRKKKLKNLARRHSVKLLFLPAYSPDLNPIENTWANMKRALPDILSGSANLQCSIYQYFDINVF